jgi:DNA-binding transcriptional LysR family regulator
LNLDLLRSFFAVAEQRSLNKAAERLRVSQSTITRQMQALEHEFGGKLLERSSVGVALTASGNALIKNVQPALATLDAALAETRRLARGQSSSLRIGYLMSAAPDYLNPALAALRKQHPEVKLTLLDLSPGEQIAALRKGEIDLALIGSAGSLLAKEFYLRRIASLPVFAMLPENHRLATASFVRFADLRGDYFVGATDNDLPGYNRWVAQLGRRAGFKPKFIGDAESLTHSFSLVVGEGAVALLPSYATQSQAPGVVLKPIRDAAVQWDLLVAWQRGKMSEPVRVMLESLERVGRR